MRKVLNVPESNCFGYIPNVWWATCCPHDFKVLGLRFSSPERRRVAEAGQAAAELALRAQTVLADIP